MLTGYMLGTCRSKERELNPLELQLQVVVIMWVLGIEFVTTDQSVFQPSRELAKCE